MLIEYRKALPINSVKTVLRENDVTNVESWARQFKLNINAITTVIILILNYFL